MQQVSVLETNIGSSTTGNSANTQIIFNDAGTLRGDAQFTWNKTLNRLTIDGDEIITGDLTVASNVLKVTGDKVGIVQATPLYPLHLVGEFGLEEASPAGTGTKLRFIGDATKYNFRLGKQLTVNNTFEITPSTAVGGTTFSNPVYTVSYDGIHTFLDGAGGTRMTLNSTGLGVGASPSYQLHVAKSQASQTAIYVDNQQNNAAASSALQLSAYGGTWNLSVPQSATFVNPLIFKFGSTEMMRLDASGNLILSSSNTPATLTTNGQLTVNATSNTNLRFSYRGSDGTTRVANITLA